MHTFLSPDGQPGLVQTGRQENNGFLIVEVLLTDRTPISLATVMIYSEVQDQITMYKVLQTGINGKTEPVCFNFAENNVYICGGAPIALPAKFTIRVEYSGFYTNLYKNAQIPKDTLSVQTSLMIPLAFGTKNLPGQEKIYEALLRPIIQF
jgi:hypothetical protein